MTHSSTFSIVLSCILCCHSAAVVAQSDNASATARGKTYVMVFGGKTSPTSKLEYPDLVRANAKSAGIFGMGVGYQMHNNWRVDINITRFSNFKYTESYREEYDGVAINWQYAQKVRSTALFANISYDFLGTDAKIAPYITGGFGVAVNTAGQFSGEGIDNNNQPYSMLLSAKIKYNLAWNIGTGISVRINDHITWDVVNYKYYSLGKYSAGSGKANVPDGQYTLNQKVTSNLAVRSITTQFRISF